MPAWLAVNIKRFSSLLMLLFCGPLNPPEQMNDVAPWETNCISACHYHINSVSAVNKGPQDTHACSHTHTRTRSSSFFSSTNLQTKLQMLASKILSLWILFKKKISLEKNKEGQCKRAKKEMKRRAPANSCCGLFDRCRVSRRGSLARVQISLQWLWACCASVCMRLYVYEAIFSRHCVCTVCIQCLHTSGQCNRVQLCKRQQLYSLSFICLFWGVLIIWILESSLCNLSRIL